MSQPEQVAQYNAFISYSHGSDGDFAPGFQRRLEAFARKGRSARALRVFRDDANLAANPDLWHSIEAALSTSEWLVLLASPRAADSPWVGREIEWWLRHRSPERILIGLTAGDLDWDATAGDFAARSTAVHPALRGCLRSEPRWIDLRGLRELAKPDDDDPRVQEALAEFAAPLRGVEKDELIGEHLRWKRRDRRRIRTALAVFVVLFLVASVAGVVAVQQGQRATAQAQVATARLLAATAVKDSPTDAALARLLAAEGYRMERDSQTVAALFQTVNDNPDLVRQHTFPAPVTALTASTGGIALAGTADGRLIRWDPAKGTTSEGRLGTVPVTDVAVSADGAVAAATDGQRAALWRVGSAPVLLDQDQPAHVAVSPKGTTVVVLNSPTAQPHRLATFTAPTGSRRGSTELSDPYWDGVGFPDEQTIAVTSGAGKWLRLRLADLAVTVRQEEQMAPTSMGISATSDDGSFTGFLAGWAMVFGTATDQTEPGISAVAGAYTPNVLAIRRDGKEIAQGGGGHLWLSEVAGMNDNRGNRELVGAGGAEHVAFVGDSKRLITSKGATVSVWDPDQRPRLRLDTSNLNVPDTSAASGPIRMAVSPDGTRALLVGDGGDVLLHNLRGGPDAGVTVTSPQRDVFPAFLADGTPALIGKVGCGLYAVRGTGTEKLLSGQGVANLAARITSDGQNLVCVSAYGGMSVRRLSDGEYIYSHASQDQLLTKSSGNVEVGLAAISDDGRYAAWIAGKDNGGGQLTVVDSQEKRTTTVPGISKTVDFAGDRLLVSHADGSLDVRDPSGNLIRTIPGGVDFASPMSWVPGSPYVGRVRNDGTVAVINIDDGTTLGVLQLAQVKVTFATAPWYATAVTGVGATGELLTANPGGSVARWAASEQSWLTRACQFAGRDLQPEEWRDVTGADAPADLRCQR
ncbi:toll/interleukin-1 receptor domain-containing protein [Kutzneria sp. CA-103260]|uniref:toll/interleukin-1 receptor domain-containing protein n=1 Tax=Kutzneria sp. CA-103260 TaxID=2802641 RepID=UPI001BA50091|nr:toll/interleukin-1 receptor domain-containing protein [Kutzneria sp. CA-103260]QUQ64291.1 TIR domain protein [Kutzneria sp. CA-103260]